MLVYTIKELCRTCYTCVRECPARAIRIVGGQAEVITERCVACGNCTKVCSQGAKVFVNTVDTVTKVLGKPGKKAALVAPSFPAEFHDVTDHKKVVGMIRALGFDYVVEVSFGADLVAHRYRNLINEAGAENYISSDCPAIVSFIRFYHPDLTRNLIPVVSPMVAMARVMRKKHGDDLSVVFIGPCVAKKSENPEVDVAITFLELREMFESSGITAETALPSEFDPPLGGRGAIFPVTRGLLQTAGVNDDAITGNIIAAEGRIDFQEAIKEFEEGMMGQLSAGIAHELNNPLGVVIMYSNILLDECKPDDPVREDIQLIVEQAARCKKIVGGLLNFARKNQVNHQYIDIRKLTESSIGGVVFPENITAVIDDRTTSPDAAIDSEQMTQVLTNLFRNAIDAMPGGGKLTISLEDTVSDVVFIVSDTGTGIREEDKPKIFEPFFTTKGIGKGTGLGLATTYGIVKMHKGQITVETNCDPAKGPTGTTFKIILPRRPE